MMSSPNAPRTAAIAVARFGQTYGYRFEGDSVELNACVQLLNDSAYHLQWALQLHAYPVNSSTPSFPHITHLLAETLLPPIAELAGTTDAITLIAAATPPAGEAEFNLTLSLVARQLGQPDEVHDVAHFARSERFIQPRLAGAITCVFSANEVQLALDSIENPRASDNVSGTLSLELWALNEPYTGGAFEGMPLAGVILGRLSGQENWSCASYALHYAPPTAGQWNVALMLREWTGSGYTTRDYRNLAEPLLIASKSAETPAAAVVAPPAAPAVSPIAPRTKTKSKATSKKTAAKPSKPVAKAAPKPSSAPTSRTSRAKKSGK